MDDEVSDKPFFGIRGHVKKRDADDDNISVSSAERHEKTKEEEREEARMIFEIQISSLREKFEIPHERVSIPPRGTVLEAQLTEQDIILFHEAFQAIPNGVMDVETFKDNLKSLAQVVIADDELNTLFLKMDENRDGFVNWNEFLSFILLEMKEKDSSDDREELHPPLSGYPIMYKTHHRLPVIRITFHPIMQADRTVSFIRGRYVTISRDGMIHYWTLDFELEGTFFSECPELKIRSTWITDMVCLPDVNIICTSSTERDLRFYDCTANRFDLRIMITRLDFPVTSMCYNFPQDINRDSKLIAGTMSGSILVFHFTSINKGPFFFTPGKYLTTIRYEKVLKGGLPGMRVVEYNRIHDDWVKQVGYYPNMNSFLSCAAVSEHSLIMVDSQDNICSFNAPKGINCFTIEEAMHILVTGGVDCSVRMWNVFVPNKPSSVFLGHHAPIVAVITQDSARRVYSLSKDKCIKVWDVPSQNCIQTYIGMPSEIGSSGLCTLYNPSNRNLLVGGHKMALLVLGVVVDTERSDGFTHSMGVVRCLYNPLFKCVVTVGLDSLIMVWDPWEGKRIVLVRNAHTRAYYGNPMAMEITAATFDPGYQQLLTGARDGTLKVWNFNSGTCVRTMNIDLYCEVTNVIWLHGRILAVGWNRHVTEFADDTLISEPKIWETRHTDDVLCAAVCGEQALATSSYNGELILWRLETGQAYRRYSVAQPQSRIILTYQSQAKRRGRNSILTAGTTTGMKRFGVQQKQIRSKYQFRKDNADRLIDPSMPKGKAGEMKDIILTHAKERRKSDTTPPGSMVVRRMSLPRRASLSGERRASLRADDLPQQRQWQNRRRARRVSLVRLPGPIMTRTLSVTAMLFLETRPMRPDWGTLIVALDKGLIQMWSHHTGGGCLTNFLCIHMAGDYVCSMSTDPENKFLFTGTALGYIKVWLMENYGFPECEKVHVSWPRLRVEFPFLWRDRVEGRAKRSLRDQKWPLLVNSYRGHLLAINQIECLMENKIVITASSDATVRLWTLGGRYLGTLGSVHEWHKIKSLKSGDENIAFRIPPDVNLVASSATMKVLKGGAVPHTHYKLVDDSELLRDLPPRLVEKATYGRRAASPVLGSYYDIPRNDLLEARYKIECFRGNVPVYRHLHCVDLEDIQPPPPPEILSRKKRVKPAGEEKSRRSPGTAAPSERSSAVSAASNASSARRTKNRSSVSEEGRSANNSQQQDVSAETVDSDDE